MKSHPIIFSSDMIRAILEGRKTQTRRVIELKDVDPECIWCRGNGHEYQECGELSGYDYRYPCRCCMPNNLYGQPGDQLFVKETWAIIKNDDDENKVLYRADGVIGNAAYGGADFPGNRTYYGPWKSSLFMPRWASRITLEIVNVRVERIQEIKYFELESEGISLAQVLEKRGISNITPHMAQSFMRDAYIRLWDSLNAKRGFGWDTNPWVWVIEFKRIGG